MLPTRRWIALGFLLAAPVFRAQSLLAQTAPSTTPHHHRKSHKAVKPVVLPPLPSGPLRQLPMDQIPPTPASVTFQDGLLAISAQNSSLGEILRHVQRLTGASFEIPQNANDQRVVTRLGPGAPRDVLAGLLNGSAFNYVMLGSNSDPMAVSSLILMSKPSAAGDTQTAANTYESNMAPPNRFPAPQPFPQAPIQPGYIQPPAPAQAAAPATADADDSKDDEDNTDENADDQAQPGQPEAAAGTASQDQQQPTDPNQHNAGPRTPEQILEMLRRQQQQSPNGAYNPQVIPPQQ